MVAIKPSFRIEDFPVEKDNGIAEILASRLGIGDRARSQTNDCNCDSEYTCDCNKQCHCDSHVPCKHCVCVDDCSCHGHCSCVKYVFKCGCDDHECSFAGPEWLFKMTK